MVNVCVHRGFIQIFQIFLFCSKFQNCNSQNRIVQVLEYAMGKQGLYIQGTKNGKRSFGNESSTHQHARHLEYCAKNWIIRNRLEIFLKILKWDLQNIYILCEMLKLFQINRYWLCYKLFGKIGIKIVNKLS
jgi:hypothetical protein